MKCKTCLSSTRRDFLRMSLGTSAGAMIASKFGWALPPAPVRASAKRVILLWMSGGPSQLDTWDPKPGTDTGGSFKAIDTALRGVRISEHLPRMAERMDRVALVRTVHSNDPNHQTAIFTLHTGYKKENTIEYPHFGCMIANEIGDESFDLPHVIRIGGGDGGCAGPGYLGPNLAPLQLQDLADPLKDIRVPERVTKEQFDARAKLLAEQNREFALPRESREIDTHRKTYEQAMKLVNSKRLEAFDLSKESDATRKRYGDTDFGRACLMARRLVETGVTFAEVDLGGWDTHNDNFNRHRGLLDRVDPGMAGLLDDLSDRAMLDDTLVIWMGEFGRTPRVNEQNGRDHFTKCWSVVLAGGGIQPGRVIGTTDASGRDVEEDPVSVQDLFATIYHCMGVDTSKEYISNLGRPIKILDKGFPVKELIS